MNRGVRALTAMLLVMSLLAITGCGATQSASQSDSTTAPGVAVAPAPPVTDGGAVTEESYSTAPGKDAAAPEQRMLSSTDPAEPMIVRNASMEVRVDDTDAAVETLKAAAKRAGAEISNLTVYSGEGQPVPYDAASAPGPAQAVVTMRVPADKLEQLEADAAKLGVLLSQSASADDVTEQVIDLEARLKNLRAEETRLRSFLNEAKKVSDLLAVEAELSRVRGEIEAMQAQLTYLERQVAKASLTVTLSEPAPIAGPTSPGWDLRQAISNGIQGAFTVINVLVTAVIALSPVLLVGLGMVLLIRWRIRARRARRAAAEATPVAAENPEQD